MLQLDGGGTRRPGSASMNPPLSPLPANKREGKSPFTAYSPIKRLTMSSHQDRVAAHRKPALLVIVCMAERAPATAAKPVPPRPVQRACRQQGNRALRGGTANSTIMYKLNGRNCFSYTENLIHDV
ncbi:MAG: hypothetical protein ABFD50_03985 [Smithella sp.]